MDEKHRRFLQGEFLEKFVFKGLTNRNDGFDVDSIKYFSESDFEIVLIRVEEFGIAIHGIEPWRNGEFYAVLTDSDFDDEPNNQSWVRKAFYFFKGQEDDLQYAASYTVPNSLLNSDK